MTSTPTAYWPVPSLLRSLSHAGWGPDLAGRKWQGVRSALYGLAAHCDDHTGRGVTTAEQIADNAGLSTRWVRRCLNVLEDLGLVEWQRGGIAAGRCIPSAFRINKKRLVELIRTARRSHAERVAERRARNKERAQHVQNGFKKRRATQNRWSSHAELDTKLSSQRGEPSQRGSRPANPQTTRQDRFETVALASETRRAVDALNARARVDDFHAKSGFSFADLADRQRRSDYLAAFRHRLKGA